MYGNVYVNSDTIGLVSRSVSSLHSVMSHEGGNKVGVVCLIYFL